MSNETADNNQVTKTTATRKRAPRKTQPTDLLDKTKVDMKSKVSELDKEIKNITTHYDRIKKQSDKILDELSAKTAERDRIIAGIAALKG